MLVVKNHSLFFAKSVRYSLQKLLVSKITCYSLQNLLVNGCTSFLKNDSCKRVSLQNFQNIYSVDICERLLPNNIKMSNFFRNLKNSKFFQENAGGGGLFYKDFRKVYLTNSNRITKHVNSILLNLADILKYLSNIKAGWSAIF